MIGNESSFVGPDRSQNLQPSMFSDGGPDWSSIANTALSFAGPIGAIINPLLQWLTNEKNRRWQSEQAELQNQRNLEQWQRENAYNLPSAMMQRYLDAGLNPNLIYGQPSLSADSPNMVAPFETPNAIAPQFDVSGLNQSSQLAHQNKLTDTEIKNLLSDTPYSKANLDEKLAQVKSLVQQIQVNQLPALISTIKAGMLDGSDGVIHVFDDESTFISYKEMVRDAFSQELELSVDQLRYLLLDLSVQMGTSTALEGSPMYNRYKALQQSIDLNSAELQRLKEFNRFCGILYQGQATEAAAVGSLKALESDFYGDLAMPPDVITTGVGAFSGFLKAILKRGKGAKLIKKTSKKSGSGFEEIFEYQ